MIKLPLVVCKQYVRPIKGKTHGKNYWLSMNNYRNWYFQTSNDIKKMFGDTIREQIRGKVFETPITAIYYYNRSGGNNDTMNAIAVLDKFFMDCLVAEGCIPDDNNRMANPPIIRISDKKNTCYVEIMEKIKRRIYSV